MSRDPTNATLQALEAVLRNAVSLYTTSPATHVPYYGEDVPEDPDLPYLAPGEITPTPTEAGREVSATIDGWTRKRSEAARLIAYVVDLLAAERPGEAVPLPARDGFVFTQSVAEFTNTIEEPDPKGGDVAFHAVIRMRLRAQSTV